MTDTTVVEPPDDLLSTLARAASSLCSPQDMAGALRRADSRRAETLVLSAYERASEGGDPNQIEFWQEVKALVLQ